jgi:hypothetical protein
VSSSNALTQLASIYSQVIILRDLQLSSISENAWTLGISELNLKPPTAWSTADATST